MPEDNIVTIENITDGRRKVDFKATVKQQDPLIRTSLAHTAHQIWGQNIPIVYLERETTVWSDQDHRTAEEFEAFWYAINKERSTSHPVVEKLAGRTQTIAYEVLGISVLSAVHQPLGLAIGRPRHFDFFADQKDLLSWEGQFRQFQTGVDAESLNALMEQYTTHGPSKVFKTIFLHLERAKSSKTTTQSGT